MTRRLNLEALVADKLRRRGLERVCEVTGEAMRAALEADPTLADRFPQVAWRDAIGMRTLVAHAYHRVDAAILLAIVRDEFPALVDGLESVVAALQTEGGA
ncbi:MAG: HepT-like ribonuclease domain-containing protein [Oceanicaulis sp.]